MSEWDEWLERLVQALYESNAFPSKNCKATGERVLRVKLLPLLEAGQACREEAENLSEGPSIRTQFYDAAKAEASKL